MQVVSTWMCTFGRLCRREFNCDCSLQLPERGSEVAQERRLVDDLQPAQALLPLVHLENRLSVADRAKQMKPILEDAKRQNMPVIIAGDFIGLTSRQFALAPLAVNDQPAK